jgi:hypothetical protein
VSGGLSMSGNSMTNSLVRAEQIITQTYNYKLKLVSRKKCEKRRNMKM